MNKSKNKGFLIFEALIALLIFSIGIISIIDYQKKSVTGYSNSQNRLIAISYANKLSNIILLDSSNVNLYINKTADKYIDWENELNSALPYAKEKSPSISIINVDGKDVVSIVIYWKNTASDKFSSYSITIGVI